MLRKLPTIWAWTFFLLGQCKSKVASLLKRNSFLPPLTALWSTSSCSKDIICDISAGTMNSTDEGTSSSSKNTEYFSPHYCCKQCSMISKRMEYTDFFPSPMGCYSHPVNLQIPSDVALNLLLDCGVPGTNPKEGSRIKPRPLPVACWSSAGGANWVCFMSRGSSAHTPRTCCTSFGETQTDRDNLQWWFFHWRVN